MTDEALPNRYERDDYLRLAEELGREYGLRVHELHDDIRELFQGDAPVARVIYAEDVGMVVLCFHVALPSVDAVQLFERAKRSLMDVAMSASYYVDREGTFRTGQEAHAHYEAELRAEYASPADEDVEYLPETPVTLIVRWPIYAAGHPLARDRHRRNMRACWGQ